MRKAAATGCATCAACATCTACASRGSKTIASAIGCARGGGRGGVAASSAVTSTSTTVTASPACRVRSVSWIAIRRRYRGRVSAWPSVNPGCAKYSDCDCVCWRRIGSEKQTQCERP